MTYNVFGGTLNPTLLLINVLFSEIYGRISVFFLHVQGWVVGMCNWSVVPAAAAATQPQ